MIPDFPHTIRIILAPSKKIVLRPDDVKSLPCWLSQLNWSGISKFEFKTISVS